ncbi:hypothetical protein SOE_00159, partial [Enterococcus faecalis EnGen0202]
PVMFQDIMMSITVSIAQFNQPLL